MALLPWIPPPEGMDAVWWPINSKQRTAIESPAKLLLFGGASGGGKSDVLVADAAQEVDNPNLRGLLLRKSFTEMNNIIDRMMSIYRPLGGHPSDGGKIWKFPSGAQVRLGYLASDADVEKYQGSPFSWLGIDEAGNHPQSRVRAILPWLASTDPTLRVRARFTANPGGVGADWLMHVFLRDKCPMCYPKESVEPGCVYAGPKLQWTDGRPVGMTVSFIPALVEDNPLYGEDKINMLRSQEGAIADKLLKGCWCELAGRYFSFLDPTHKLPYAEHPGEWWNTHIISIDYGFGDSWAAAGLWYISEPTVDYPTGRAFKIGELPMQSIGSEDFAKQCIETFIDEPTGANRRQVSMALCDPANDSHTNVGRSNMEIMADVFAQRDIPMMAANKGRVANFQNLYRMLKSKQVVITDACPMTFKSLNTRMHDPARSGDIKKMKGDPLDDLLDETSYFANTYFTGDAKPKKVYQAEKMAELAASGMDERSLNINRLKILMDQGDDEDAPVRITRVGMRHGFGGR